MRTDFIDDNSIKAILWALTPPDRLICLFMLQTGWRVDDVLNLRSEDIQRLVDSGRRTLTIIEKKTGKKSKKQIPAQLLRESAAQAGRVWLFEGRDDYRKHRTRQAVWQDLKRTAAKFNIKINLSAHSLRKNYAVEIYKKNGIEAVQKALNHDNIAVSYIYALSDELTARHGIKKGNLD